MQTHLVQKHPFRNISLWFLITFQDLNCFWTTVIAKLKSQRQYTRNCYLYITIQWFLHWPQSVHNITYFPLRWWETACAMWWKQILGSNVTIWHLHSTKAGRFRICAYKYQIESETNSHIKGNYRNSSNSVFHLNLNWNI